MFDKLGWNWPTSFRQDCKKMSSRYLHSFVISSHWKMNLHLFKFEPLYYSCLPNLFKIGWVVPEKKTFKCHQCNLAIFHFFLSSEKGVILNSNKLESPSRVTNDDRMNKRTNDEQQVIRNAIWKLSGWWAKNDYRLSWSESYKSLLIANLE